MSKAVASDKFLCWNWVIFFILLLVFSYSLFLPFFIIHLHFLFLPVLRVFVSIDGKGQLVNLSGRINCPATGRNRNLLSNLVQCDLRGCLSGFHTTGHTLHTRIWLPLGPFCTQWKYIREKEREEKKESKTVGGAGGVKLQLRQSGPTSIGKSA